ncbi:MAG: toll/interleukin-1 receptor domain-containing protein [Bacteroidales bacterium]
MNALEKIKLIEDIGSELQSRMTFSEINAYLSAYGIPTDHVPSYNSKRVYVKEILPKINDDIVIQIANELQIEHNFQSKLPTFKDSTTTFWKKGHFKLFISHLSSFKKTIGHLKTDLEKYGISSFVAHEDIEPTKEWQEEIEKGLFSMDALCAVLTPGFKESNWTDQEVGVAVGRGVLVIPIRRELDPYGFIGKYQGFQALGKNVDQVAEGIFLIISKNPKTRNRIISCLVDLLLLSNNKTEALERINALMKINDLPKERIIQLKTRFIENNNLKDNEIIKKFNELTMLYNIEGVKTKDFDKVLETEIDDLPF